ncbi:hypothetical protein GCM10027343_23260 [Noviherbaspirillum agri]
MRALYCHADPGCRPDTLIIVLPGALQQPNDLVEAGFVEAVIERGMPLDVVLVDLRLNFVGDAIDRTSLQRLHDDVIAPAQHLGYREIWLAGISIGGFMSLAYASHHPGCIAGLCLLAPYPGSRLLTNEIRAAGGVHAWSVGTVEDDLERHVWRWLQSRPLKSVEVYFGYGLQDRFAQGQQMMAAAISNGESDAVANAFVDAIEGAHDLPVWRRLWGNFLDRIAPRLCQDDRKDVA